MRSHLLHSLGALAACRRVISMAAVSMRGQTGSTQEPAPALPQSRGSAPKDALGRTGSAGHLVRAGGCSSGTLRRKCQQGIPDR